MLEQAQPDPDLPLLQAIAGGDVGALDALYTRHGRSILSYLLGQLSDQTLAEEVLQDVMLAVWHGARDFRGESRVRTWLLAIARRQALSKLRRRRPEALPLYEDMADEGVNAPLEDPVDDAALRAALRQLPGDQRETLELIFYHHLSGQEAAEVMGVSPGTIKSRLHRAKTTLRGLLQQKEIGHDR